VLSLIYITERSFLYFSATVKTVLTFAAISVAALLQACSESPQPITAENIKTVSVREIDNVDYFEAIQLPGITDTKSQSQLSFGVDGTVSSVRVDIGTQVHAGDMMASLDQEPYRLALENARSESERARVTFEEAKKNYERLVSLRARNLASEQNLDASKSNYENARAMLRETQSQVRLAERDLSRTEIHAPYDGMVSGRRIEPFEEVTAHHVAFTFDGTGARIVESSVPEILATRLQNGDEPEIIVHHRGRSFRASVAHLSRRANEGLDFPVKLRIDATGEAPPSPGLVVSVTYRIPEEGNIALVPHGAVVVEPVDGTPFIYRYDQETGTVSRTPVTIVNSETQGYWVRNDLGNGDLYVAAGAAFISDGQRVWPTGADQ